MANHPRRDEYPCGYEGTKVHWRLLFLFDGPYCLQVWLYGKCKHENNDHPNICNRHNGYCPLYKQWERWTQKWEMLDKEDGTKNSKS